MRYLLLCMLCLSMNALSAGQGVTKPEEPAKTVPQKQPEPQNQAQPDTYVMPGELDQYEDDDVVDQPDYLSDRVDVNPVPKTSPTPTELTPSKRAKEPSGLQPEDLQKIK